VRVGVLALQGDFQEHVETLRRLDVEPQEIRLPADLEGVDGVIIPGGESTTITRLLDRFGLRGPLARRIHEGMPVMGTCAGAIVLANHAEGLDQPPLGVLDIDVRRNAFGRQVDSFEAEIAISRLGADPVRGVFIRAPVIEAVRPPAETLATLEDGTIVAAQQGSIVALVFHPELTEDLRVHQYFLSLVDGFLAQEATTQAVKVASVGESARLPGRGSFMQGATPHAVGGNG